jgi:hypothetical protein
MGFLLVKAGGVSVVALLVVACGPNGNQSYNDG